MAPQQDSKTITSAPRTPWTLDPTHSAVEFSVRHMMFATVRGRFRTFNADLYLDEADPAASSVQAEIDVSSIDTGVQDRDAHLRSADFFDVENHPKMTFRSTRVEGLGTDRARVHGDLTIRGVTRPVVLDVTRDGVGQDPWGNTRAAYTGQASIERDAYGLKWNQVLETGGVLVGNTIKVEIRLQAVRTPES